MDLKGSILKQLGMAALVCIIFYADAANAQQIITDGNTNTTLNVNGTITDVTTTTTEGNNAFNSFSKFNVDAGNTVNLHVPAASNHLINLVHDEATNINGVLNSIKNNEIGGSIFLANPHGIVVGTSGVINVGSLTAVTPTTDFMNNFFDAPGNPADASVTALINGTAPINPGAEIKVDGQINALDAVKLETGAITSTNGQIKSGSAAQEAVFEIQDVLNIGTATNASEISIGEGTVKLVADNYELTTSSPEPIIDADSDIIFSRATAGDIEVSDTGILNTAEINKVNGNIIIGNHADTNSLTENIDIKSNVYTDGKNIEFNANDRVGISSGILVSTRDLNDVWNDDHLTALSQGNSGNLKLSSATGSINILSDILTFGNNGYLSGDIEMIGDGVSLVPDVSIHGNNITFDQVSTIKLDHCYIQADSILTINDGTNHLWFDPVSIVAGGLNSDFLIQNGPLNLVRDRGMTIITNLDHVTIGGLPLNTTEINIDGWQFVSLGGDITVPGDINLTSHAPDTVNIKGTVYSIPIIVDIYSDSIIKAVGNINISEFKEVRLYGELESIGNSIAGNQILIVNADGSINPSSNIGATVAGGYINVADFGGSSGPGGIINITSPTITGTGTLIANGGASDIIITNNSMNNMILNDLTASSDGQVIINGTPVTSYGDLTIITSGGTGVGEINVVNNGFSDVLVNGNITGADVNLETPFGDLIGTGKLITADDLTLVARNITNYQNLDVNNSTYIYTTNNCLINGSTANLTANVAGALYFTNIDAGNVNITTGEEIRLYNGTITGDAILTSVAPAYDGAAEINLGFTNTDLAIGGNLTAIATNGNIYYYGGSVGGNATFNAAESYDHRYSLALGRLRDLEITGNLDANTAGHFVYLNGSVG